MPRRGLLVEFQGTVKPFIADCEALIEFHTRLDSVQTSPTTGETYCFPNDVAIVVFYTAYNYFDNLVQDIKLVELPFASEEECIDKPSIFVSGFPLFYANVKYVLPQSSDIINAEGKVIAGFHWFKDQVISEGAMRVTESGLAELEISATFGMSGSPILFKDETEVKIMGVYCGGPPLPGQKSLTEILKDVINENYDRAYEKFLNHPFYIGSPEYKNCSIFREIDRYFQQIKYVRSSETEREEMNKQDSFLAKMVHGEDLDEMLKTTKIWLAKQLIECLFDSSVNYKNVSMMSFNSGISVRTEAFRQIGRVKKFLDDLEGSFESVKGIEELINRVVLS